MTIWSRRNADGRTFVRTRDGRKYLWYRVVLWDALGRELRADEVVHHINGDCTDDRIENLLILDPGTHAKHHVPPFSMEQHAKAIAGLKRARAAKTHCVHGHEFTAENTLWWRTKRQCRTCKQEGERRRSLVAMEAGGA